LRQFSFSKNNRLLTNEQFQTVLTLKKRTSDDLLIVYAAKNQCGYPRLGVSVGKSCGSAIIRNRFKRLIREAFRLSKGQMPENFDYLVMISAKWRAKFESQAELKKAAEKLKSQEVQARFLQLVAKLVKKPKIAE
jgi:ribonuclease P protein component